MVDRMDCLPYVVLQGIRKNIVTENTSLEQHVPVVAMIDAVGVSCTIKCTQYSLTFLQCNNVFGKVRHQVRTNAFIRRNPDNYYQE